MKMQTKKIETNPGGIDLEKVRTGKAWKGVKSLDQCVREADALGISYAKYVQRGLDHEKLDL